MPKQKKAKKITQPLNVQPPQPKLALSLTIPEGAALLDRLGHDPIVSAFIEVRRAMIDLQTKLQQEHKT